MATKKKSGINIKKKNKGKLRKTAKKKKGEKLSAAELKKMKKSKNPKTRKRANFALNAKKWKKSGRKRKKG
jgi:oligoendopeptidase F